MEPWLVTLTVFWIALVVGFAGVITSCSMGRWPCAAAKVTPCKTDGDCVWPNVCGRWPRQVVTETIGYF